MTALRTLVAATFLTLLLLPAVASEVTWTPIGQGGGTNYISLGIDPNDPYRLYLAADVGGPWRSRNRGLTWEQLGHKVGLEEAFHEVQDWAFSPQIPGPGQPTVVYGASFLGLLKSVNGGESWDNLTDSETFTCDGQGSGSISQKLLSVAVNPFDPNDILIGTGAFNGSAPSGQDTRIYRSTDGGGSWTLVANGATVPQCTGTNFSGNANVFRLLFHPAIPGIVYAVTDQGVWMSNQAGARDTWSPLNANLPKFEAPCQGGAPERINARNLDVQWDSSSERTTLYVAMRANDPSPPIWKATVEPTADPSLVESYQWQAASDPFLAPGNPPCPGQDPSLPPECLQSCQDAPITGTFGCSATFQDVAVDPTNSNVVIAASNADAVITVFRSDDGGASWTRPSDCRDGAWEWERQEHYSPFFNYGEFWGLESDPTSPGVFYWLSSQLYRSVNAGVDWEAVTSDAVTPAQTQEKNMTCDYPVPYSTQNRDLGFPCPPTTREQWLGRGSDGTWVYEIAVDPASPATLYLAQADNSLWSLEGGDSGFLIANQIDGIRGQVQTLRLDSSAPGPADVYAVHSYHSNNSKEGLWVGRKPGGSDSFIDFSKGLPGSPLCYEPLTYEQCEYGKGSCSNAVCNPCPIKTAKRVRYPMVIDQSGPGGPIFYLARPGYFDETVAFLPPAARAPGFGIFKRTASTDWVALDEDCFQAPCNDPQGPSQCWDFSCTEPMACWSSACSEPPPGCTKWPNPNVNSLALASGILWAGGDGFISWSTDAGATWTEVSPKDGLTQANGATGRVETMAIQDQGDEVAENDVVWAAVSEFFSDAALMPVCQESPLTLCQREAKLLRITWNGGSCANPPDGCWESEMLDDGMGNNRFEGLSGVRVVVVDPDHPERLYVGASNAASKPWPVGNLPGLSFTDDANDPYAWNFEPLPHATIETMTINPADSRQIYVGTRGGGAYLVTFRDTDADGEPDWADRDDGLCAENEDCNCCPADCPSGVPPQCGDGICEAPSEDCYGCPEDCSGVASGPQSGRYCCGEGGSCARAECNAGGYQCVETSLSPFCCGDDVCSPQEDATSCAVDCGCVSDAECDDANACTADACVAGVCQNTPEPDSISCSGGICCGGTCGAAVCVTDTDCDDQDACSTDTCLNWGTCAATCDYSFPACDPVADGCCGPACTPATDPDCCLALEETCTSGSECCSASCNGICCLGPGEACISGSECCSGDCKGNGTCK